ncbi:MAG: hypothetical protein U9R42_08355 [Bacteroidota bacterium]|nr:hypothetical protein [Bacteroidota bacterium]
MQYLTDIKTEKQLKAVYRTLARKNHPDIGGNMLIMQTINSEYNFLNEIFRTKNGNLSNIKEGDNVIVNGSVSEVIKVMNTIIKVRSIVSGREAYFNKKTGNCISNSKFQISRD